MEKPVVVVLGPSRTAVSGVATHLNLLFGSNLTKDFVLIQFQVGSEGRTETPAGRVVRLLTSPFALAFRILLSGAAIVHINTSLNRRAWWRDLSYLIVAKLCGARVVYQVHGGALPQQFGGGLLRAAFLRAGLMLPDVIGVLAECELAAYRAFVPRQDVVMLPNGIDLSPYAGLAHKPNRDGPLRLIYVGRITRNKGVPEALRAFVRAAADGIAAKLVVAGSGPDEAEMKSLAQTLGLGDDVRFVGPVFGEDKLSLLAQADLLVFPTCEKEGLPYALLECMAAGIPAVTTRVGAMPDVMLEGVHGLFVPLHDEEAIARAIELLARDRGRLRAMGKACRQRIAHSYSIERLAGDLREIYGALAERRRSRRQPSW